MRSDPRPRTTCGPSIPVADQPASQSTRQKALEVVGLPIDHEVFHVSQYQGPSERRYSALR
jgi:hypothetical protein